MKQNNIEMNSIVVEYVFSGYCKAAIKCAAVACIVRMPGRCQEHFLMHLWIYGNPPKQVRLCRGLRKTGRCWTGWRQNGEEVSRIEWWLRRVRWRLRRRVTQTQKWGGISCISQPPFQVRYDGSAWTSASDVAGAHRIDHCVFFGLSWDKRKNGLHPKVTSSSQISPVGYSRSPATAFALLCRELDKIGQKSCQLN